jgi:hypothetical protein
MGHRSITRQASGLGLGGLLLLAMAGPVGAVDPIAGRPLPDEPPIVPLPHAWAAIVVDLDTDGAHELLTVGPDPAQPVRAAVTAGWIAADGSVAHANSAPLPEPAGVGPPPDETAVVLMRARRAGSDVALLATGRLSTAGDPCCAVWDVSTTGRELELLRVADLVREPQQLVALDMDADGTDEIFVTSRISAATVGLSLLRWTGADFDTAELTIPNMSAASFTILDAGETDGRPGEEVLLTGSATLGSDVLFRIGLRGGEIDIERAETGARPPGDSGFASVQVLETDAGPAIVASDGYGSMDLWSWPPDGEPTPLASHGTIQGALAVLGTGPGARLFTVSTPFLLGPQLAQYRLATWPGSPIEPGSEPLLVELDRRASSFVETTASHRMALEPPRPDPFVGRLPGGLPGGRAALAWAGQLITPDAPSGSPMALLPGMEPIGAVGPDGAWLALRPVRTAPRCCFHGWLPGPDVARPVRPSDFSPEAGPPHLVATATVLEPEADDATLAPTWYGAATDRGGPGPVRVGTDPVEAEIEGPEGTRVWWSVLDPAPGSGPTDPSEPRSVLIGPSGSVRGTVLDAAVTASPSYRELTLRMWAVTPAGHGYAGSWAVTLDREPPPITLTVPPLVDLDPTIAGIADGAVSLTVAGRPVPMAADGSFTVAVSAGLLPTAVRVVAVDDLGNRAEHIVERVWGVDYRRIPLVPLAVAATIGVGILLYLRRPRGGTRHPPADVGTFEELGG